MGAPIGPQIRMGVQAADAQPAASLPAADKSSVALPTQAAPLASIDSSVTQLLNPAKSLESRGNFAALRAGLLADPDPKIQAHLQALEEPDVKTFIETNWTPASIATWDWKAECKAGHVKASDDLIRLKIVAACAGIANILVEREAAKFQQAVPTQATSQEQVANGWSIFGTSSHKSDVDYAVATITGTKDVFRDNAIQGHKVTRANLVFTALFQAPSLRLLDAEFYPPQIATFMKEPMSMRASLSATISQLVHMCSKEDFDALMDDLEVTCPAEFPVIKEVANDCRQMYQLIHNDQAAVPDKELARIIYSERCTALLTECGAQIDKMIKNDPKRDALLTRYCVLDSLRSQFLPEVFVTRGAFSVVCEGYGGQKHQLAHDMIEAEFHKPEVATQSAEERQALVARANLQAQAVNLKRSEISNPASPQELLECIGENGAYLHHRPDLVDASKYGTRVYESALMLLDSLIATETAKLKAAETPTGTRASSKLLNDLKEHREVLAERATEMSVLESSKRGKFFEKAFTKIAGKVATEDAKTHFENAILFLKALNPASHGESLQQAAALFQEQLAALLPDTAINPNSILRGLLKLGSPPTLNEFWNKLIEAVEKQAPALVAETATKTVAVAQDFFKKTKFGSATFVAMIPSERTGFLKQKLANRASPTLSPKMQALAAHVSRAASPQEAATATQLLSVSSTEVVQAMKRQRGVASDEELFKKVQAEARGTFVKMLGFSLRAGGISPPAPIDTKKGSVRFSSLVATVLPKRSTSPGILHAAAQASH